MASPTPIEDSFHTSFPEAGEPVQTLRDYGIGIDTHKRFIQVCVLKKREEKVFRTEKEFTTQWGDLVAARAWAVEQLQGILHNSQQVRDLRFCIESTGTYHMPVLLAWGGLPSVVNPLLANPSRRKTDVLDARLLAYHSITGLWPQSYIPPPEVQQLRCLIRMRDRAKRERLRASNMIGNFLLRFGHTFHAHGAMMDSANKSILEDLLEGRESTLSGVCPIGIPEAVRVCFLDLINLYEQADLDTRQYLQAALEYARSIDFPHEKGLVPGKELLDLLKTVPGIGEVSALLWLAEVVDVRRFDSPKQIAAYCGTDPSLKVSAGKVTEQVRRKGNVHLHGALLQSASMLIHRRSEPLGRWGYNVRTRHHKGGYRKACGAVARRLAIALFHVHAKLEAFSYEGYRFKPVCTIESAPISAFPNPRFRGVLERLGIEDSVELHKRFYTDLAVMEGVGEKCLNAVQEWLKSLQDCSSVE